MLNHLLAAAAALIAATSFATAQTPPDTKTVQDPAGRFSVQTPKAWPEDFEKSANGRTAVLVGVDPECQFHAIEDIMSTGVGADAVKRSWTAPIGTQKWMDSLNPFRDKIWESAGATLTLSNERVDASGYFPIQRAIATGNGKTVAVAIYPRPGVVIYGFCRTWKPADQTATFDAVLASVKTPQDDALIAAGAAADADREAKLAAKSAQDAATAAPPAKVEQPKTEAPKRRQVERVLRK
jgi:hypothetical protein